MLSEVAVGEGLFGLAPLVILFPLLGVLINVLLGNRWTERVVGIVASLAVALAFGVSLLLFAGLLQDFEGATVLIAEWINIGELHVEWALQIDTLAVAMLLMVTGVSTLIHIYATGYMHDDVRFQGDPKRFRRFFVYFNLFVMFMVVLVTANNYLMMFVGWEGVGLCSFLLISFWFEKGEGGIGNALAGKKAFITNRVGDFGFMIAMFLMFWAFGSLGFEAIFSQVEAQGMAVFGIVSLIALFLVIGVTGKSAQIPLHVWLPDAMAGPTPVSALIHAATMVTAGIYLILRSAPLFELASGVSLLVTWVGAITGIFAATIAVAQNDIKKVLAYSTISQLGFMVAAAGLGAYVAALFHLIAHAFFKALLFLSSGSVIQGVEHGHHHLKHAEEGEEEQFDPQDMRVMGGLRKRMRVTFVVYVIGALALVGVPPLAGFFSKDEIILEASQDSLAVDEVLLIAAFFTAFYMGRQIFMVFFDKPRSEAAANAQESPRSMTIPLIILAGLAVFGGLLNFPGDFIFAHRLEVWLEHTLEVHAGDFNVAIALISVGLIVLAVLPAWFLYARGKVAVAQPDPLQRILGPLYRLLENKYYVDEFYNWLIIRPYTRFATFLAWTVDWHFWHDWFHDKVLAEPFRNGASWLAYRFDLGVIDAVPNRLAEWTRRSAVGLGSLQTGYVRNYALALFIGALLLLTYLLLQ